MFRLQLDQTPNSHEVIVPAEEVVEFTIYSFLHFWQKHLCDQLLNLMDEQMKTNPANQSTCCHTGSLSPATSLNSCPRIREGIASWRDHCHHWLSHLSPSNHNLSVEFSVPLCKYESWDLFSDEKLCLLYKGEWLLRKTPNVLNYMK